MDRMNYYRRLQQRGYETIGEGLYSYVVAKPGSDRVIKVGAFGDPWPSYIRWAIDNGHDGGFAPKVYSLKFHHSFYVAVVERLVCTISEASSYAARREQFHHGAMYNNISRGSKTGFEDLDDFLKGARRDGFVNDLHGGNMMIRHDGQIVITDPCSMRAASPYRIKNAAVFHVDQ